MTAKNADARTSAGVSTALPAISDTTEPTSATGSLTAQELRLSPSRIQNPENAGSTTGKPESESESRTSKPLVPPSSGLNKHWQSARSVREFAAQVNLVATAVLNGQISDADLEQARLYAGLSRTVVQAMTAEIQRARFLKEEPNLTFEAREPI